MAHDVVVVDYGIGNVFSVCNALKKIGADPILTRSNAKIQSASRLLLPGVGAFAKGMEALQMYGLNESIESYAKSGRPFLGICLGMQMLMERSFEFGEHTGLGFIEGEVRQIPTVDSGGAPLRVPHISWADVSKSDGISDQEWRGSVLCTRSEALESFYFVHSFMAKPRDARHLLAHTSYGGNQLTAAIRRDNIVGVQFHPERSGAAGLELLRRFVFSDHF